MIELGLARVYSFPDNRKCLAELLAAEGRARAERRGIWTEAYYFIRDAARPDQVLSRVGHYELVEGRVLKADEVRGQVYFNFGRRWSEDFTVVIPPGSTKVFEEAGIDLLTLENALIRVRGWIEDDDGPRLVVTHPEQIEVLKLP
jgi:micrococcal nuclease